MLGRYTLPEIGKLWTKEAKFEGWLEVELAYLQARAKLGLIPETTYLAIREHAKVSVKRIEEIEAVLEHDLQAFVGDVHASLKEAGVGEHAPEFHHGLTSYDIEDPAFVLDLRHAGHHIVDALLLLAAYLDTRAQEHRYTLMIARTHGQFAEPDTFGRLLLVYKHEVLRAVARIRHVMDTELSEAKMSGAVGNFGGGMSPALERDALAILGLKPALAETQILQRDRFAAFFSALAIAGAAIEQMCRTFWEMMRSDVGELREPRKENQRGSSRMAHKRNPILTERLMGMARLLRGHAHAAMDNIATPEGRDISQSCVERHMAPDATSQIHFNPARFVRAGVDHIFAEDAKNAKGDPV